MMRKSRLLFCSCIAIIVCTMVVSACERTPANPSGIEGMVLIGPICPGGIDETETADCGDIPLVAKINVKDRVTERIVATGESGEDGSYRIELPQGEYIIEPVPPNPGAPPLAENQDVTVVEGQFAEVTIVYDSGIR